MPTWTTTDALAYAVYRGATAPPTPTGREGNSAIVEYRDLVLSTLAGTSWVAGFAHHFTATDLATPPTSMVNRLATAAPNELVIHDTASGRTSNWPATFVTVNASAKWASITAEVPLVSGFVGAAGIVGSTLDYPAGTLIGDLVVGVGWRYLGGGNPAAPGDWTQILNRSDAGTGQSTTVSYIFSPVNAFGPQIVTLMP